MITSIQDAQWVLRAQCGDREALEALLRSAQPPLRRYLSSLVGQGDADDVLQDVMIIIVRKISSLDDPQLFRPWIFRIASREAFRHLKKRRLWVERHDDDAQLEHVPTPHTRPSSQLLNDLLATGAISPASRAVLLLHFEEELSKTHEQLLEAHMADETGDVLRRSLDAVDRHRHRLTIGLGITVVLLVLTFAMGVVPAQLDGGTAQAIVAQFFMLGIWMTGLMLVVVIQITVMTRRILRAIELAVKK